VKPPLALIPVEGDLTDRLPGREEFVHARRYVRAVLPEVRAFAPDLVYWRHSRGGIGGALLSQELKVPYVLEYNGSEVWISEKWDTKAGKTLPHRELLLRAEAVAFRLAARVIVVSEVLRDELVERGVPREKVHVEPNAIDLDRFPRDVLDRDRESVRARLGFAREHVVCGFIGTMGKWHGAQVLARAARPAIDRVPELRFLVIGDGLFMPEVKATLARDQVADKVVLTGLVPQVEAPALLNACDLYVSPHVPNDDGSRFFGSPTKLFEYMALGRGIVASSLDQIGEVLRHDETALLVPPGDQDALVAGIVALARDKEKRDRLGRAARAVVEEKHTWRANVRSLL
jgi:glycosyltransferase involved in cell wall biosynthesis